jgi:hypothetical protein
MALLQKDRAEQTEESEGPAPDSPLRVLNDQTRDHRTIRYEEWPEYRSRGYCQLPEGMPAVLHGNVVPEHDPAAAEDRDLFAPIAALATAGQREQWAAREALARKALDAAADQLAARIGRPRIPREHMGGGGMPASAVYAADLAQAAITAESVAKLAAEIDALHVAVAALQTQCGTSRKGR